VFDPYILLLVASGLLILLVAWLPMLLKELPLSLPIFCVGVGYAVFSLWITSDEPHPLRYPQATERIAEMLVIVSLMGCGLKLDRPLGRNSWRLTWRLLGIAMPLCILAVAWLGWSLMGLSLGAAILLGAVLAPTDPVLASDVQVGPPGSGEEDEVRFALTSEAGLNDGLAFPFVHLAIAIALYTGVAAPLEQAPEGDWTGFTAILWEWLGYEVLYKLVAGVGVGWLVGKALGYVTFNLPNRAKLSRTGDGFLALAMTFLSYGLTEMAHGYGFLAVFITAIAFRRYESNHAHHERLHDFAEQTERLFMMVMLVMFGGALAEGLLAPLTWEAAIVGLLLIFVVRPLCGWIAFIGVGRPWTETAVIGFFGIRGVGSIYYVAFAFNQATWTIEAAPLWAAVGFVILVSIVLHGTTVTPVMRMLDRKRQPIQQELPLGSPAE